MASSGPAGSRTHVAAMVAVGYCDRAGRIGRHLLLEVALQAEVGVALGEHLLIGGTVRVVAACATFADGIVFEYERASLCGMAFGAGVVGACERCSPALVGRALVRVMAVGAGHLAVEHLVGEGHAELGLGVEVALEAGVG